MKKSNVLLLLLVTTLAVVTAISWNAAPQSLQHVTPNPPASYVLGGFSIPAPKAYGGDIRGVAVSGSRAFPGGRATDLGLNQRCYTCSCMTEKLTSEDRQVADRVCADNCQGTITNDVVGPCR